MKCKPLPLNLEQCVSEKKSEGRLPRGDRHKAKMQSGELCHVAALTYDPSHWRPKLLKADMTGVSWHIGFFMQKNRLGIIHHLFHIVYSTDVPSFKTRGCMSTSTRLFLLLPSAVSLEATGLCSPYPFTLNS